MIKTINLELGDLVKPSEHSTELFKVENKNDTTIELSLVSGYNTSYTSCDNGLYPFTISGSFYLVERLNKIAPIKRLESFTF
jgi:hypothetical protein